MAASQSQLADLTPHGADPDTVHELADLEASSNHFSWVDILKVVAAAKARSGSVPWALVLKLFIDFTAKDWPAVMQDIIALLEPQGAPATPATP